MVYSGKWGKNITDLGTIKKSRVLAAGTVGILPKNITRPFRKSSG
jgi:hypothetical protein